MVIEIFKDHWLEQHQELLKGSIFGMCKVILSHWYCRVAAQQYASKAIPQLMNETTKSMHLKIFILQNAPPISPWHGYHLEKFLGLKVAS